MLTDVANLDHVQTDDGCWPCLPDASGSDFFFYDITWRSFCDSTIEFEALHAETGVTVSNLATLREARHRFLPPMQPARSPSKHSTPTVVPCVGRSARKVKQRQHSTPVLRASNRTVLST